LAELDCFLNKFQIPNLIESAVTNARFASLHGLPVVRMPPDDARSASQIARSSRACMVQDAGAAGFRLRPGGGRFAPALFH
jgi:hypothetical protein